MATSKTYQNPSDFEEYIRDLLECPVCMETIKSVPVYQCTNGHVICKDCIKKLDNCPICRNDSTPARNLQLEKIVQRLEGIQHEKRGSTTATPTLQKWGKGSVRVYGTSDGPNLQATPGKPCPGRPHPGRPHPSRPGIIKMKKQLYYKESRPQQLCPSSLNSSLNSSRLTPNLP